MKHRCVCIRINIQIYIHGERERDGGCGGTNVYEIGVMKLTCLVQGWGNASNQRQFLELWACGIEIIENCLIWLV